MKAVPPGTFRCDACGGIFEKNPDDEAPRRESLAIFGPIPEDEIALVCDDCFAAALERVSPQSELNRFAYTPRRRPEVLKHFAAVLPG